MKIFSQFMKATVIGDIYSLSVLKGALIILGESSLGLQRPQGLRKEGAESPSIF